jgi:hypothetical protein
MGAGKEVWMDECERVAQAYVDREIDADGFWSRMRALGFNSDEISDHQSALDEDRDND